MNKLKRIYIEISNICNLQCSFCPVVERDNKIMDSMSFEGILQKVAPFTEEICLHLMGEPLAHPEFEKILRTTEKYKTQINLTTNAIFIDRFEKLILESKQIKQINFSLHSFKDNFKDKPLAPYMQSVLAFSENARLLRPDLYVNFRLWTMKDSKDVTDDNSEIISMINDYFNVEINENVDVSFKKSKNITGRLYVHFDSRFVWPSPNFKPRSRIGTCQGVQSQLGIHADGTVVPCCLDKEAVIKLGNIHEQSFEDIYQSKRTQSMLEGFLKGELVEDLCQKCPFIERFDKKAKRLNQVAQLKSL